MCRWTASSETETEATAECAGGLTSVHLLTEDTLAYMVSVGWSKTSARPCRCHAQITMARVLSLQSQGATLSAIRLALTRVRTATLAIKCGKTRKILQKLRSCAQNRLLLPPIFTQPAQRSRFSLVELRKMECSYGLSSTSDC